jgi:hypothetical protein
VFAGVNRAPLEVLNIKALRPSIGKTHGVPERVSAATGMPASRLLARRVNTGLRMGEVSPGRT